MPNFSLRFKLLSLPAITLAGLVTLVAFSFVGGQKMAEASRMMLEDSKTQSARLSALEEEMLHLEAVVLTAPVERDFAAIKSLRKKFEEDAANLEEILEDSDHPGTVEVDAVRAAAEKVFSSVELGDPLAAADLIKSDFMPAFATLTSRAEELRDLIASILEKHHQDIEDAEKTMELELFLSAGIVTLASLGVGGWVSTNVSRRTNALCENMQHIAQGDYTNDLSVRPGDELATMMNTLDEMRKSLHCAAQNAKENIFRGTALQSSDAMVMMADLDFKITWTNASLQRSFIQNQSDFLTVTDGFDPDRVIGSDMDFYHPLGLRERVRASLSDPKNLPHRTQIGIGRSRYNLTISSVPDADGNPQGYVVEWYDCTKEFLNQAAIDAIEASQIKVEFLTTGEMLDMNEQFCRMTGQTKEELKGSLLQDTFQYHASESSSSESIFETLLGKDAVQARFEARTMSGGLAVLEGGFFPVLDKNRKVIRILLIGHDVTAVQQRQEEAEQQRKIAERDQKQVVTELSGSLSRLSQGDLTARIDVRFAKDYEDLRQNFNMTLDSLDEAFSGFAKSAAQINSEAGAIAGGAEELSRRTESQAASLEQTAAAIEEMTTSVRAAAENSERANTLVTETSDNALASSEVVRRATDAMKEIERSSKDISAVTDLIEGISFQTNLLALNAGVEAARAGEAGRGFAVVASEVRELAQRSSQAASEIGSLIRESSTHVSVGTDLVAQAAAALIAISEGVTEVASNVEHIANSAREQSVGLSEIDAAMKQLDASTQQNASMCEESTASSVSLKNEASSLTGAIAKFKTEVEPRALAS